MFVASENELQREGVEIPLLGPQAVHFRPAEVFNFCHLRKEHCFS